MAQFADNLNTMLAAERAEAPGPDGSTTNADPRPDAPTPVVVDDRTTSKPATPPIGARKIEGPTAAPIDLLGAAAAPMVKRLLPLFGGLVLRLVQLRRRHRSS